MDRGEFVKDDLRLNRRLPSIGQQLSITGVDFNVEVTGLTESTSVVDGMMNL